MAVKRKSYGDVFYKGSLLLGAISVENIPLPEEPTFVIGNIPVPASVVYDEITFTADIAGSGGNTIELVFSGSNTIDAVVDAWNTANPTNTVSFTGKLGTYIPTVGTAQLSGGNYRLRSINSSGVVNEYSVVGHAHTISDLEDWETRTSNFLTTSALDNVLSGYATTSALNNALGGYATTSSLSGYATTSALDNALSGYATTSALNNALGGYATTSSLSDYVATSALSGYVTTSALNNALGGYATTSALDSKLSDATSDGKQYARKDGAWVEVVATGGGGAYDPGLTIYLR